MDTFQIIATLKHFALGWPVSTSSMFSGLGALLINVDLLQLECSLPAVQYQQKWYIMMLSQSHRRAHTLAIATAVMVTVRPAHAHGLHWCVVLTH